MWYCLSSDHKCDFQMIIQADPTDCIESGTWAISRDQNITETWGWAFWLFKQPPCNHAQLPSNPCFNAPKYTYKNTRIVAVSFEWASTHISSSKLHLITKKNIKVLAPVHCSDCIHAVSDVITLIKRFPAEEKEWLLAFLETLHWK